MRAFISPAGAVVLLPLLAGFALALLPYRRVAAWLNVAAAAATFVLACRLPWRLAARPLLLVDPPAAHMAMLTSFVGAMCAWSMAVEPDDGDLRPRHLLFQALLAFTLLALLCNDLVDIWICLALALPIAVVAMATNFTADAIAAAGRYLLVGAVGLALAMFGSVVLFLAVRPAPLTWTGLAQPGAAAETGLLDIAVPLLAIGFGTLAGLAPMHAWLPELGASGAAPIATIFTAAMQLPPLLALFRLRRMEATLPPGLLLIALGLASLLVGAVGVWRARGERRAIAYASIAQSGVTVFAIGLGSAAAMFAAIVLLTLQMLTRTALFQCEQNLKSDRCTWFAAMAAMAGLPPFGIFAGWFLVLAATAGAAPWLLLPLGIGLVLFAGAQIAGIVARPGTTPGLRRFDTATVIALAPAWLQLLAGALLGYAMPAALAAWFTLVASALR